MTEKYTITREWGGGVRVFNRKEEKLSLSFEINMEKNPVLDLPGITRLLIRL
jgi:hypothetical protein